MDGLALLQAADAAGLTVNVNGDRLVIRGPRRCEAQAKALLAHKQEVVAHLTRRVAVTGDGLDAWEATDWQALYDERAGIREYEGEMFRHEAERLALDDCVTHWLARHPPEPIDDNSWCVHCGAALGDDGMPVLAGGAHTRLHSACHAPWLAKRRAEAERALEGMGVCVGRQ